MNLSGMLVELKRQRSGLNRAIAALEALQKPRNGRKLQRAATEIVGHKRNKWKPRKNGTTGILIPFSPGRNQE